MGGGDSGYHGDTKKKIIYFLKFITHGKNRKWESWIPNSVIFQIKFFACHVSYFFYLNIIFIGGMGDT